MTDGLIVPEDAGFKPVFRTIEDERIFDSQFNYRVSRQAYIDGRIPVPREDYHLTKSEEAERQRNLEARSRRSIYLIGA